MTFYVVPSDIDTFKLINAESWPYPLITRTPTTMRGWLKVRYKGRDYQLLGGVRGNYYIREIAQTETR